jgi:hypothetical protein
MQRRTELMSAELLAEQAAMQVLGTVGTLKVYPAGSTPPGLQALMQVVCSLHLACVRARSLPDSSVPHFPAVRV